MASPCVVLDGGVGSEVMDRMKERHLVKSEDECDGSWSAGAMLKHPEILRDVHLDFLRAGSRVITANTYAVKPGTAETLGVSLKELIKVALGVAMEAKDMYLGEIADTAKGTTRGACANEIQIAYSLPPLRESFIPDKIPDDVTLLKEYTEIVEALMEVTGSVSGKGMHVDILMMETLMTVREVEAALKAINNSARLGDLKLWLSIAVYSDAKMVAGEPIEKLVDAVWFSDDADPTATKFDRKPSVFNINCSTLDNTEVALKRVKEYWAEQADNNDNQAMPILGAYANGFKAEVRELKSAGMKDGDDAVWSKEMRWTCQDTPEYDENGAEVAGSEGMPQNGAAAMPIKFSGNELKFAKRVARWRTRFGCGVLGGCCCVTPKYMQALRLELESIEENSVATQKAM